MLEQFFLSEEMTESADIEQILKKTGTYYHGGAGSSDKFEWGSRSRRNRCTSFKNSWKF